MHFSPVFPLSVLILILPLGLDTLGVSLSLGMRSVSQSPVSGVATGRKVPLWLRTAVLFALAEMLMPIVGLLIGAALSSLLSDVMHYIGAFVLMGIGIWEFVEEGREYFRKRRQRKQNAAPVAPPAARREQQPKSAVERFQWGQQLLLALSVSLDELAVGFSFGSVKSLTISPLMLCIFVGLQGFLMAVLGIGLGRALRFRLKVLKEWSELLSAALLIALGVWFLFS
jgi:putative Mn2+ efflux pump MntP